MENNRRLNILGYSEIRQSVVAPECVTDWLAEVGCFALPSRAFLFFVGQEMPWETAG
jgi:hypothetical protein